MKITGNDFIEILKDNNIKTKTFTAADQEAINLDDMFDYATQQIKMEALFSVEEVITGEEPISLRLETGIINLPVRYINAISKIVINDPETEISLYMMVEHPLVTRSGLRIETASTVAAYLDDPDSVKAKIAAFFTKELMTINEAIEVKKLEEQEDTEPAD